MVTFHGSGTGIDCAFCENMIQERIPDKGGWLYGE